MSLEQVFETLLVSETPGFSLVQLTFAMLVPFLLVFPCPPSTARPKLPGDRV